MRNSLFSRITICSIVIAAFIAGLPNILPQSQWPDAIPYKTINLGLDLQGGAYLLLEADVSSLRQDNIKKAKSTIDSLLRRQKLGGAHYSSQ